MNVDVHTKNVQHCQPPVLDAVAVTLHLGHAPRERRPHLLGGRHPTSSVQQRRALLEILPRLPQAAAGWTSECTYASGP